MADKKQTRFYKWKQEHETLWQFIMFAMMGCFTTIVELGSFAVFNFWIFIPFRNREFSWWLIDYSVENGGMTAFLAIAISFAISQIFNFYMQRKTTFKANNNAVLSAIMYAIMIILVYFLQLYIPTLIRVPIVKVFGATFGDLLVKMISMTSSMLIQFPISKWVIMRRL